jgi:hypothetical protein
MRVRNVHRRAIGSPGQLGALLDGLGSDADRLWPRDRWPRLRLDGPLRIGARGGHGPVRYQVELYEPSRRIRFRFERPRGFDGTHEFCVIADPEGSAQLVHVLEARMSGAARLSWSLMFCPLHDALIEDALDSGVPGDLIETGVWRGGSTIFMRGILKAHGVTDRKVWVADSFQGFPDPEQDGVSARSFSSPELAGFLTGFRSEASPAHAQASLMGADRLRFVEDGPEPPAGQHCVSQDLES